MTQEQAIKRLNAKKGIWCMAKFARQVGISRQHLCAIMSQRPDKKGYTRKIPARKLAKVAEAIRTFGN